MAEVGAGTGAASAAPTGTRAASAPSTKATDEKKTITVTFEGKDLPIHARILQDAEDADRSASLNLLRHLRQKYEAPA